MATRSKRYEDLAAEIDPTDTYSVEDALDLTIDSATANFEESIELHARLNIDPTQADEQIRDTVVLPAGTGQETRVVVFATGEAAKEAQEAGADEVGGEDLIDRIDDGWLEFDQAVATPDMMSDVSRLGPTLGPRGMMPNNKAGTVTFDVADAIEKLNKGQVELRTDETGIIHTIIGTSSMERDELLTNLKEVLRFLIDKRPPGAKGQGEYIHSITLSPTMGPSVKIEPTAAWDQ
jgi:large subunit ribosomal protein L1